MNKKIYLLIFTLVAIFSVSISFWIGQLIVDQSVNSYEQGLENSAQNNLNSLTNTVRNDLLNENIRSAKVALENNINDYGISAYGIFKNNVLVDESINFSAEKSKSSSKAYKKQILFANDGDVWGHIVFIRSQKNMITFIQSLKTKLVFALLILFLINLTFIFSFMLFLNKTSDSFLQIISKSEFKQDSFLQRITHDFWKPFLEKLYFSLSELDKTTRKNQSLRQQEEIANISRQIAHDIRSPLTALSFAVSSLDKDQIENISLIQSSIKRINDISNFLLSKSRPTEDLYRSESTNIVLALSEIIAEKKVVLGEGSGISLLEDFSRAQIINVYFQEIELKRIISNVLNNSIESFHGDTGTITISIRKFDDRIQVTIADDGVGIPEDILPRIGEKNFTFGKEHRDEPGSGLGLFYAKELTTKYGGDLKISSKLNIGTMVTLYLQISS